MDADLPKRPSALAWAALAAPAALYLGLLARHAIDIPRGDDFISLLPFLIAWPGAAGRLAKGRLLWAQYFSHRIVLTKLAALADLHLFGYCNFAALQAAGWVAWAALAFSLALTIPAVRRRPLLGLPALLLLMQPQGFTNLTIAMQAVQNIGVVLLAFWALRFAQQGSSSRLLFSLALAGLALLASVNGGLVFPAAAIALAAARRFRSSLIYAAAGAIAAALYLHGYVSPAPRFALGDFLGNAAAMFGAPAALGRLGLGAALPAGALLILLCLIFLARRPAGREHGAFLLFLLLSAAMAARGRVGWGWEYMLQDRYRLYGLLAAAVLWLGLAGTSRRWWLGLALPAAGLFCFLSYARYFPDLLDSERWAQATAMNLQLGRAFPETSADVWRISARNFIQASDFGLIDPPAPLGPANLAALRAAPVGRPNARALEADPDGAVCGRVLSPAPGAALALPEFGLLQAAGGPWILPVAVRRSRLSEIPVRLSFLGPRFGLVLPDAVAASGTLPVSGWARDAEGALAPIWFATAAP